LTRYLLDTNVLSNATKPAPSAALAAWLGAQRDEDLFISAWTLAEIERGIRELPTGKKRRTLERWFEGADGPRAIFAGRILVFDEAAASAWARLMSEGTKLGRPRSALDMIIAAVAGANDCVVVTENERDFSELNTLNPSRVD